jgi:pyrimidine operon attenuation protein/uracil phosphoribosyltransferase
MGATIYKGATAPESLTVVVTSDPAGLDLTTVSAAMIKVKRAGDTALEWAASIVDRAAHSLTVRHTFVGTDTDVAGDYEAVVYLTVPDGTMRTTPQPFTIADPFP